MKLVGYLRVSTDRQAERGLGLEVQRAAIIEWAASHEHELVAIISDEGVSGTREAADRPGLSEAMNAIQDGVAQGVVVARLDRLARTLTIQEAVLSHVWKVGGHVFSTDLGEVPQDDADDPMRTFVRQVMGAAAQLERSTIVARLRAGRKQKHVNGGYAYGSPAFGYRALEGDLVPDELEQLALARIRELRAAGESLRAIAAALEAEGHRPRRSSHWHPHTVGRILARFEEEAVA